MPLYGADFDNLLSTRAVVQPDAQTGHAVIPFPAPKPGGGRGVLLWRKCYEMQLAGARAGDGMIGFACCTASTKESWLMLAPPKTLVHRLTFSAPRPVKTYLSTMVRCALVLTAQPLALVTEQDAEPGVVVAVGSGENSWEKDNVRPYYQPPRIAPIRLPVDAPFLSLVVAVASNTARKGNFAEVYGSSGDYGFMAALLFKPLS